MDGVQAHHARHALEPRVSEFLQGRRTCRESYGLSTSGKVHEVSSREYSRYEDAMGKSAIADADVQILDMSDESFNQRIKSSSIAQRYEQDLRAYRKSGGANGDVLKRILAELGDKTLEQTLEFERYEGEDIADVDGFMMLHDIRVRLINIVVIIIKNPPTSTPKSYDRQDISLDVCERFRSSRCFR